MRQSLVVAVLFVMPGQTTDDEFTIQEHVRQINQRVVNRQVDVSNRPVVSILPVRDETDHLAADCITDKLRGVVAEGLTAFWCVDSVEA